MYTAWILVPKGNCNCNTETLNLPKTFISQIQKVKAQELFSFQL